MEGNHFGHLSVLDKTLTTVSSKVGGIQAQLKAVGFSVIDLYVGKVIQFYHAFHFHELHIVAILVRVSFVFVDMHDWVFTLFNAANDELLRGLTVLVCDFKFWAIVEECITSQSQVLRENEADSVLSAQFIDFYHSICVPEELGDYDDIIVGYHLVGEFSQHARLNMWVQFTKLRNGSLSSGFVANVAFTNVKVCTAVRNARCCWVVNLYDLWSRQDQILRDFDSETSHANNEDLHLG